LFAQPGFFIGGPDQSRGPPTQRESSFHDRRRLSSAPSQPVPTACSTVFRQRVCHFPPCSAVFYLCRHCDRGQRYCSSRCREKSRRLQRREANRRYQQSLGGDGRLDHRQRQREYRQRLKARVTDQSSLRASPYVNLTRSSVREPAEATPAAGLRPSPGAEMPAGWVVCQVCGRRGRWVNPFAALRAGSFPEVQHDF